MSPAEPKGYAFGEISQGSDGDMEIRKLPSIERVARACLREAWALVQNGQTINT